MAQPQQPPRPWDFRYWSHLCQTLTQAKDYEAAARTCDQALWIRPRDRETLINKAQNQFALGKFAEALAAYDLALLGQRQNSLLLTGKCASLLELKQPQTALPWCSEAIQVNRRWGNISPAQAWFYRGRSWQALGELPNAVADLEQAVAIDPAYPVAWVALADVLTTLDRLEDALAASQRALSQVRPPDDRLRAKALTLQGVIYRRQGRDADALASLTQALALDQKDPRTWSEQAAVLITLSKWDAALVGADWALKLSPNYAAALGQKCQILNEKSQFQDALTTCEKALQQGDSRWDTTTPAVTWQQHGIALVGLKRYADALSSLKIALDLQPNNGDFLTNQAVILWYLERYQEALVSNQKALQINPRSPQIWFNQGRILVSLERNEEALNAYETGLKQVTGRTPHELVAILWLNQGVVQWRQKQLADALKSTSQALEIQPDLADAWYNQGLILNDLRKFPEALTANGRALKINPKNPDYWLSRAVILRALNQLEAALECLDEALKLDSENAKVLAYRATLRQLTEATPVTPAGNLITPVIRVPAPPPVRP
ncbi:tetratricopeptide repeat protein [Gloeomargarita lithophora]|nr:tetratricopeptide repeat protein [Gloeomargarita lithophora]